MAMTIRLPVELHAEGQAYAEKLGIPFTALLAVALRDYLDGRRTMPLSERPSAALPVKRSSKPVTSGPLPPPVPSPEVLKPSYRRPKSVSDPCPCGAKSEPYGYPVKWKHCHGKA